MHSEAITVHAVRKSFGRTHALRGVTLEIARGEAIGIIGPNGAGKTTLMACLLGLVNPDQGTIRIDGLSPHSLTAKRRIGYVPERLQFSPWMSARRLVALHSALCGIRDPGRIEALLERVGLEPPAWDRAMKKYSRGMLQRTALAQALAGSPRILFLDEPTSGIDPVGAIRFREIIRELKSDDVTVVINSHQLDQMEHFCDRVAFLRAGEIAAVKCVTREERLEDVFLEIDRGGA